MALSMGTSLKEFVSHYQHNNSGGSWVVAKDNALAAMDTFATVQRNLYAAVYPGTYPYYWWMPRTALVWLYTGNDEPAPWGKTFPTALFNGMRDRGIVPVIYILMGEAPYRTNTNWTNGDYDTWLNQFADDANAWRSSTEAYGLNVRGSDKSSEIIFMFGQECTAGQPWSVGMNGNTAQSFKNAFAHVSTRLRSIKGATHINMLWSAGSMNGGMVSTNYAAAYPGDTYCQYVGFTNYTLYPWTTPAVPQENTPLNMKDIYDPSINEIRTFTQKPIIISETSINDTYMFNPTNPSAPGASITYPDADQHRSRWISGLGWAGGFGYEWVASSRPAIRSILFFNLDLTSYNFNEPFNWTLDFKGTKTPTAYAEAMATGFDVPMDYVAPSGTPPPAPSGTASGAILLDGAVIGRLFSVSGSSSGAMGINGAGVGFVSGGAGSVSGSMGLMGTASAPRPEGTLFDAAIFDPRIFDSSGTATRSGSATGSMGLAGSVAAESGMTWAVMEQETDSMLLQEDGTSIWL